MSTISGVGNTAYARSLYTAAKVLELSKNDPIELMFSDIEYTTKENDKYSIDGGLAFALKSLEALDANGDGVASAQEGGAIGKVVDLNNDGKISGAENLAYTMYQDAAGEMDGKATAKERYKADLALLSDPETAKAQMQKIYDGNKLGEREAALQQKQQQEQQSQMVNQQLAMMMNFFMGMMQQLFSNFGMQAAQQSQAPQQVTNNNQNYQQAQYASPYAYAGNNFGFAGPGQFDFKLNLQF